MSSKTATPESTNSSIDNLELLRNKTLAAIKPLLPPGCHSAISTENLAQLISVKPGTPRRSYCVHGHYLGLVPMKLANGRLLWPVA